MRYIRTEKGMTLTELLVALSVFLILMAFMYPTFSFVSRQNDYINSSQSLSDRGQRIIDYMAEDIRMMGFVVGPKDNIPLCPSVYGTLRPLKFNNNIAGVYDELTFITTEPVEVSQNTSCVNDQPLEFRNYELNVISNAPIGANSISVDVPVGTCVPSSTLTVASGSNNAKSLIAFETASQVLNVYTVTGLSSNQISFTPSLNLVAAAGSTVYTVRLYQYTVDETTRELKRRVMSSNCTFYGVPLDTPYLNGGGIDGLQFEFLIDKDIIYDNLTDLENNNYEIKDIKAIRIWLLVRSSTADRFYTNDDADPSKPGVQNYVLGTVVGTTPVTGVEIAPFGDHYRRILLNKTVEVKNLAIFTKESGS